MGKQAADNFILFSPVGSTDPVSRNVLGDGSIAHYDGSMIHICRTYRPEQVVLYLSEEMRRFEDEDRRYTESLELLGEELGHEFVCSVEPDCFVPEDHSVVEAQDYDTFYNDFEEILRNLHREYPDYKLLINVSSGTPAMKTALYLLANFLPFKTYPVQVSTPLKKSNRTEWLRSAGGLHAVWPKNVDSVMDVDSRCVDVCYDNLSVRLVKQNIRELVDAYDYSAALVLANGIRDYVSDELIDYLAAAVKRVEQRWTEITDPSIAKAFGLPKAGEALGAAAVAKGVDEDNPFAKAFQQKVQEIGEDAFEQGDENGALIEYLLWVQMKQKRGDYADFIRGLTPMLFALMQLAIDEIEGLHIERDGCERGKHDAPRFDSGKVQNLVEGMLDCGRAKRRLRGKLLEWGAMGRTLDSKVYCDIIDILKGENGLPWYTDLEKLREIEQSVRNQAAHEIRGINDGWIERNNRFGYGSEQILEAIKRCAGSMRDANGEKVLAVNWKSYDKMNELVKSLL